MDRPDKSAKRDPLICLCNSVPVASVEAAIVRGCDTLGKIFDSTNAGAGPCGGTCQPNIRKMLDAYKETGQFPEPEPVNKAKRDRALKRR